MKNRKRKHSMWWSIAFIILILAIGFCYWQNNDIVITIYNYTNSKIPTEFNGYQVIQISDLHNKRFGKNQSKLMQQIKGLQPDLILVTGDLVDRRTPNIEIAMEFINQAVSLAPVYYVKGNHESRFDQYPVLEDKLINAEVKVLNNEIDVIEQNGFEISIIGAKDPTYLIPSVVDLPRDYDVYEDGRFERDVKKLIDSATTDFSILLCHRPEILDIYSRCNADITFTGHAHGGQIRLPFIGGLFGPRQGFFPKFTSGAYEMENTTMIVSRGLGNSLFPFRVFNRPEIVVVTLNNK